MLRAVHLKSRGNVGPSSLSPSFGHGARTYALSVQSPRVWPGKSDSRVFNNRKTYLYHRFTSLLNHASSQPLLFIHHKNFKASGMAKLRREVTAAGLLKGTQLSLLDEPPRMDTLPQLNVIRSSIFGVALRDHAPFDAKATAEIANMARGGGLAVINLPTLDPPILHAVLRALERSVPKKKVEVASKGKGKDDDEGRVPGRRMKRQKPMLDPGVNVVGALIEGRVFGVEKVQDVSKLPTLETLRQQIVGLISSPMVQLASVMGQASGGKLARTLEGLMQALEEAQPTTEASRTSQ